MHQNISQRKNRRYTELGEDIHKLLFIPETHGGNRDKVCDLCGLEKESTRITDGIHMFILSMLSNATKRN